MTYSNVFKPEIINTLCQDHALVTHNTLPDDKAAPMYAPKTKQKSKWGMFNKFLKRATKVVSAVGGFIGTVATTIYAVAKCRSNHAKVVKARTSLLKELWRYEQAIINIENNRSIQGV